MAPMFLPTHSHSRNRIFWEPNHPIVQSLSPEPRNQLFTFLSSLFKAQGTQAGILGTW